VDPKIIKRREPRQWSGLTTKWSKERGGVVLELKLLVNCWVAKGANITLDICIKYSSWFSTRPVSCPIR